MTLDDKLSAMFGFKDALVGPTDKTQEKLEGFFKIDHLNPAATSESQSLSKGKQTIKVGMFPRELADLYALKTLCDYLDEEHKAGNFPYQVGFFRHKPNDERWRQIIGSSRKFSEKGYLDVEVGCTSDIGITGDVTVDISILKNAVMPMTSAEIDSLKDKYGVPKDQKILVLGFADYDTARGELSALIEKAVKHALVYVIGATSRQNLRISDQAAKKTKFITEHGILKDYYAMADVAVNARNLAPVESHLHNFVEATEGGPLFIVTPKNTAQYGYKELVERGVIVECVDAQDLTNRVVARLSSDETTALHRQKRSWHLMRTRQEYLPAIARTILRISGQPVDDAKPKGLAISLAGRMARVMHVASDWGAYSASTFGLGSSFNLGAILPAGPSIHSFIAGDWEGADAALQNFEANLETLNSSWAALCKSLPDKSKNGKAKKNADNKAESFYSEPPENHILTLTDYVAMVTAGSKGGSSGDWSTDSLPQQYHAPALCSPSKLKPNSEVPWKMKPEVDFSHEIQTIMDAYLQIFSGPVSAEKAFKPKKHEPDKIKFSNPSDYDPSSIFKCSGGYEK